MITPATMIYKQSADNRGMPALLKHQTADLMVFRQEFSGRARSLLVYHTVDTGVGNTPGTQNSRYHHPMITSGEDLSSRDPGFATSALFRSERVCSVSLSVVFPA
jgi:hypothetical protein